MTAGVRDTGGGLDLFTQACQLRHAVGPAVSRAVGGGGINDDRIGIVYQGYRFDRRLIGQAEEADIAFVEHFGARGGVFSQLVGQDHQLEILAL